LVADNTVSRETSGERKTEENGPRIIDYGESTYRRDFWVKGREYEDLAERIALRRTLPRHGQRLLELGAGFGRLAPLYEGYDEVVLLDYSESLLQDASKTCGTDGFRYAACNWYHLPFADATFDTIVTVRVLHHAEDLPALFKEIARVLAPGGVYVLEFANKRNLKAIARYALRRQTWSPFAQEPVEFYPMHWDFHPRWMRAQLERVGLRVESQLTASHFRAGFLKRAFPARWLAAADGALQWTGRYFQWTPSVIMKARASGATESLAGRPLYRCPHCGDAPTLTDAGLRCTCGRVYPVREGSIVDFKNPTVKNSANPPQSTPRAQSF
jgi:SAM-dependent methyltransferase